MLLQVADLTPAACCLRNWREYVWECMYKWGSGEISSTSSASRTDSIPGSTSQSQLKAHGSLQQAAGVAWKRWVVTKGTLPFSVHQPNGCAVYNPLFSGVVERNGVRKFPSENLSWGFSSLSRAGAKLIPGRCLNRNITIAPLICLVTQEVYALMQMRTWFSKAFIFLPNFKYWIMLLTPQGLFMWFSFYALLGCPDMDMKLPWSSMKNKQFGTHMWMYLRLTKVLTLGIAPRRS